MTAMTSRDPYVFTRRVELLDLLTDHEDGLTAPEIMDMQGWDGNIFHHTLQSLRDWLAEDGDNIYTLPCAPSDWQEPWVYQLVRGDEYGKVDPETMQETVKSKVLKFWINNQFSHVVRRLKTIQKILEVIVRMTDGRTLQGKMARKLLRHVARAFEDMVEVEEEFAANGALF
jgi:hypothetical protein